MVVRKYDEELQYIEKITDYSWRIKKGFQVINHCHKNEFTGEKHEFHEFSSTSSFALIFLS
jgi:hypothetical protein